MYYVHIYIYREREILYNYIYIYNSTAKRCQFKRLPVYRI